MLNATKTRAVFETVGMQEFSSLSASFKWSDGKNSDAIVEERDFSNPEPRNISVKAEHRSQKIQNHNHNE